MIKVLIQENDQVDFDNVQNLLTCINSNGYLLERLATTDIQQFKNERYDLLLFSVSEAERDNLAYLQTILEKNIANR
jgi:hypothetical protein